VGRFVLLRTFLPAPDLHIQAFCGEARQKEPGAHGRISEKVILEAVRGNFRIGIQRNIGMVDQTVKIEFEYGKN
jgi:hypothetical protein